MAKTPAPKSATAYLSYELHVQCPYCSTDIDIAMADDELIGLALFNNRWDQLSGYEVECGNCGNDFTVDTVEY